MNVNMKEKLPYICAFITIVLWASAFPAVKYCLNFFTPEAIMLFRFITASIVMIIIGFMYKVNLPKKEDIPLFAISGFIGLFLYMWGFNTGSMYVSSGVASFIIAFAPMITLVLSIIFLKEKVKPLVWLGVFVSLGGLTLITLGQVSEVSLNIGIFYLFACAFCTATFNILQRYILRKYTAIESTVFTILFATLFMFIFLPSSIPQLIAAPLDVTLIIVYMGVFPAAASYILWNYSLKNAKNTSQVVVFLYLTPFVASFIAYIWLKEELTIMTLLGGVIIVSGMFIANKYKE